jgi:hypothetical protein
MPNPEYEKREAMLDTSRTVICLLIERQAFSASSFS